jgi:hypothetical protein
MSLTILLGDHLEVRFVIYIALRVIINLFNLSYIISSAGKTTLMDVIAMRKTSGAITGKIELNGHPQERVSFLRSSGYVEQFDVQQPELTVRETVSPSTSPTTTSSASPLKSPSASPSTSPTTTSSASPSESETKHK